MQAYRLVLRAACVVLAFAVCSAPALAQSTVAPAAPLYAPNLIDDTMQSVGVGEVRIGGSLSNLELLPYLWLIPDVRSFSKARPDSLQFDALLNLNVPWLELPWGEGTPRLSVGGVVNFAGYENLFHVGVDYLFPIEDTPFYLEAGAGLGVHNGYLDSVPPGFHRLGCPVLAHWKAGIGWNVTDRVTATIDWQHMSGFVFGCHPNQGLNHIGLVVGYKF